MKTSIDLGVAHEDHFGSEMPMRETSEPEKYYPSFHYDGKEKLDLPDSGVMTVKFRKTSSTVSDGRNGKKHYACTVEVHEILDVAKKDSEDESPSKKLNKSDEALDKLMKERMEEKEEY